jgi:hypothetical protein
MILEYFSLGRGPFTQKNARNIPALLLQDYHLILENEWNVL